MVEALVDIAQRRPVKFPIAAVDLAGQRCEDLTYLLIFRNFGARGRCDLNEDGLAARISMGFEKVRIGLEPSHQTLGVIEPVDSDHQGPVSDTLPQAVHMSGAICRDGVRGDRRDVDTNREYLRAHHTPKGLPDTAPETHDAERLPRRRTLWGAARR